MTDKKKAGARRIVIWIIAIIGIALLLAAAALQFAISRDGPAVLSAIDRIVGASDGAEYQTTISTGDHPQQKLVVWAPQDGISRPRPLPVLLFVHGGSWRSGDPESYGFIGRAFVPKGFVVVLGGYRLGEAGAYPAMLEDTASAIGWTHRNIADYGGDPDRIVIAGHSAGAYNVAMAALEERWLTAEGLMPSDIAGVVGLSGPYDFYPFDSESTKNAFGHAEEPERTQPAAHIGSDASSGTPPVLLIHGEKDTLVYPRNTRFLADKLKAAGAGAETRFYSEMEHNDPLISLAAPWRSRREVDDRIAQFAAEVTSRDTVSVSVHAETR
ncbi:alpha/beta hydrolase [Erythrobacter rubeus]|uniref:Alpha/beta hydrolase n=1 Tax=Erythrobacter rubeus TaxID=2760803 RepID=A0ABR8KQT2_9SPHN|nr:alpha/beta hydrolase [Erythrobacter rubeus]MBD2843126.1 alpha/beta hydrolase [Erythrobacter rubeus]